MVKDLTLCLLCNFASFLSSAEFFQNQLFRKIISGIPSECKTVWIQIRSDKMSGLIWFQTVSKKLSADDTSKQRVKYIRLFFIPLCFDFINEPKQRSKPPQPSRYCFYIYLVRHSSLITGIIYYTCLLPVNCCLLHLSAFVVLSFIPVFNANQSICFFPGDLHAHDDLNNRKIPGSFNKESSLT